MNQAAGRDPLSFLGSELAELREAGLYRPLRVMSSAQGPIVSIDRRRAISLASNDYLGLTHHPRVREAALAAVRDFGVGSGAVRTIAGTMTMHQDLEAELADGFRENLILQISQSTLLTFDFQVDEHIPRVTVTPQTHRAPVWKFPLPPKSNRSSWATATHSEARAFSP